MAEPLKLMYSESFLRQFAARLQAAWPSLDEESFVEAAQSGQWDGMELKARIRRIAETIGAALPEDYGTALDILYQIDESCTGFPYLFFPDFVEVYGLSERHWQRSVEALARFTQRSTSEYAVRAFIEADPERMLSQMMAWTEHPDEHVRRLASEGTRPRLPWGQALEMFKRNPLPLIPLLERLKADPSLYVRRSVANNLNDIAKDHPELVLEVAARWKGDNEQTDWIVRHACRTLVKRADPVAMALFGYGGHPEGEAHTVASASLELGGKQVSIGGDTTLHYRVQLGRGAKEGERWKLRVEYGVDYVKASGKTSLKRFLLSDREYAAGSLLSGSRTIRFADLTTRKHYAGNHGITLWVNGMEVAREALMLAAEGE